MNFNQAFDLLKSGPIKCVTDANGIKLTMVKSIIYYVEDNDNLRQFDFKPLKEPFSAVNPHNLF